MPSTPWTVHSVYQPVVDLDTLDVVGYEALVRGVAGSALASADALFAAARARDDLAGLEWACRTAAMRGVLDAGLAPGTTLFINAEPATFALCPPPEVWELADEMDARGVPVVVEITERDLAADPRALLALRDHLTDRGWMLAIDDIGADPASLAMLPLLDPDLIKLDMTLVQQQPDVHVARIMNAVNAQASLTGAKVVAEGVETTQQRDYALSLGASLAQGWLLGRPTALPTQRPDPCASSAVTSLRRRRATPPPEPATPYELVRSLPTVRTAAAPMLRSMSRYLEAQALAGDDATVVLTAFQDAGSLTGRTRRTYEAIARAVFLVGVLGQGVTRTPLPGVRGVDVDADDPLTGEWDVVVVTPHFAAALVAVEVETSPPSVGDERLFRYVLTYDRSLVLRAARILLRRFEAASTLVRRPPATASAGADLEVLVRAAGRRDDVVVHYQPVVAAGGDGRLHGVEALLRLDDGHGGALPARMFLGFAEELGLMPTFTSRLVEQACAQMRAWSQTLGGLAPPILFVNVGHGDLVDADEISGVVRRHGLPAAAVGFELTADRTSGPSVPPGLRTLRDRGHPLALDQCGRDGDHDLGSLDHVPDTVKIDRSLVAALTADRSTRTAVEEFVRVAHALGATTTAVGVETPGQHAILDAMGCDFVQGFAIAAPRPADELASVLARWPDARISPSHHRHGGLDPECLVPDPGSTRLGPV
ncbi:MAG: EAL domain-containing protein [Nocardioidaceae bacterium]|nr:EAL domain-containing protein [Nocardioidaceae bacterium]